MANVELEGQKIGNYVVERKLGEGGMGSVYRCRHPVIDHLVAVKILHREHARDPEQAKRFLQEARAAAAIGHPNVVDVFDFGTFVDADGVERIYLMMELVEGEDLSSRRERTGLGLDQIVEIMLQCCDALQASHARGIVHRDLKPDNIYVCERESSAVFVKIMDFGIAKLLYPDIDSARTRLGVVLGTPAYMSPEQCQGKGRREIDPRSDIYSLGVVMYELLVGHVPFSGSIGRVLLAHLYDPPPPPRQLAPWIPVEIEALVLRALEKRPADRFASMAELAWALQNPQQHLSYYRALRAERGLARQPSKTPRLGPR